MNESQIEAMRSSAEFLFNNKIPRNFLWEVLDEAYKAHAWMGEKLDLNEKNNYRIIIPISETKANDSSFSQFLKEICRIKSEETGKEWSIIDLNFLQDANKNKYKVTRILNEKLWKVVGGTAPGREMITMSGKLICCFDCTISNNGNRIEFARQFAVWYGDQIKGNQQIVISCHPVDMLTASANSSFKSCYRPDGEWFNGIISSILSQNTLIAYVEEVSRPGYKIGRSWVYINDHMIIVARRYGTILENHALYIRNHLYNKLGEGVWKYKPGLKISDNLMRMEGPGYLDNGTGDIALRKDVSQDYSKITPIVIPEAICLFCGKRYRDNGTLGICRNCRETVTPEELCE